MNVKKYKMSLRTIIFLGYIFTSNITCGVYKFLTHSLSDKVKTFSVKEIYTKFSNGDAVYVAQELTTKLKSDLSSILESKKKNGDLRFEGQLLDYRVNRIGKLYEVVIKLKVKYINIFETKPEKDEENSTETKLEQDGNTVNSQNNNENEKDKNSFTIEKFRKLKDGVKEADNVILNEMIEEIVTEIFDKTISKWED